MPSRPQRHMNDDPPDSHFPVWRGVRLLRRVGQRDEQALEDLYNATSDRLYSMALHWLRDEGAASEAVQDCFLRIWKKASNYDPARSQPFTWCAMILRGLCLDQLRKAQRIPKLIDDVTSETNFLQHATAQDGVADLLFHDSVSHVRTAIATLSQDEQNTINSALFDPATNAQLATRWNLPVGTVKTRIHRAMEKLRQLLRSSNPFKS